MGINYNSGRLPDYYDLIKQFSSILGVPTDN